MILSDIFQVMKLLSIIPCLLYIYGSTTHQLLNRNRESHNELRLCAKRLNYHASYSWQEYHKRSNSSDSGVPDDIPWVHSPLLRFL